MEKILNEVKEIRKRVKALHFKDIWLLNYRDEADLALLKLEKELEELIKTKNEIERGDDD